MIEKEKHVGGGVTKSKWWILALSEFWMMWTHFHALKSQWSVSLLLIITYLTITMFSVTWQQKYACCFSTSMKRLFLVAGVPHANLPAVRLWSQSSTTAVRSRAVFHSAQQALGRMENRGYGSWVMLWVICWQQPAPEKVVLDVYSSCRKGKIRTFTGPKHLIQQEDNLCLGLPFPSASFVQLLLKYSIFLKYQWQFSCLHFQLATSGLPCSRHMIFWDLG